MPVAQQFSRRRRLVLCLRGSPAKDWSHNRRDLLQPRHRHRAFERHQGSTQHDILEPRHTFVLADPRDLGNRVMLSAVNVTGLCHSLGLGNSARARAISVSQKVRTGLRYAAFPGKLLRPKSLAGGINRIVSTAAYCKPGR